VLLVQTTVIGLALLALTASALATLLHAQRGRAESAKRAHTIVFGAAYIMLAALISIPCIALAAGYRENRLGIFWLGCGVLWLVVIMSGFPVGTEVRMRVRSHPRTTLWLIGVVTACIGLLSGAIDGGIALGVILAVALLETARHAPAVVRTLRVRSAERLS
jgi:hypothetical protein